VADHPPRSFVYSFIWTDLATTISHERLSNFDETYREYSTAPTDYLNRFWRSMVKVTAGRRLRGDKDIYINAGVSKSIFRVETVLPRRLGYKFVIKH